MVLIRSVRNLFQRLPQTRLYSPYSPQSNSSEVFVSLLRAFFSNKQPQNIEIFYFFFLKFQMQLSYLTDKHQGIAIIGLNKPDTKNAFSKPMVKHLYDALDVLAHDKSVRVVIIRSMLPNVFCAGADLKERATMAPAEVQRFVTSLRGLLKGIEQLPVPVISAVDGAALGGGLEMALACDIRTVSNDAKLGTSIDWF